MSADQLALARPEPLLPSVTMLHVDVVDHATPPRCGAFEATGEECDQRAAYRVKRLWCVCCRGECRGVLFCAGHTATARRVAAVHCPEFLVEVRSI